MVQENEREPLRKGMVTVWIVWGALTVSVLMYALIAHLLAKNWRAPEPTFFVTMRNALYVVSVVEILIVPFLRKWILARSSDSKAFFKLTSLTESHPIPGLGKYLTVSIISWAIADSIAIYGLILFLLGGSFNDLYLFVGAALAVMIYYRPKMSELEEQSWQRP